MQTKPSQSVTPAPKKPAFSPWRAFLKAFLRQRAAVIAAGVICCIVLVGFLAPYVVPWDPDRPVTLQYADKGINIDQLYSDKISIQLLMSDGSRHELTGTDLPSVESGNRRVASSRFDGTEAVVTAINAGETFIRVNAQGCVSLFRVSVSRSQSNRPLISRLSATLDTHPVSMGSEARVLVTAHYTDGTSSTDSAQMTKAAELAESLLGRQDYSGGWGEQLAVVTSPRFESLTPEIASVTQDGIVTLTGAGEARIRVSLGGAATQLVFNTNGNSHPLYVTGITFSKTEISLKDVYKHQAPSALHFFGTDHQNRDIFSRVLSGTQQTLLIGFVSVAIGAVLGTILGLLAGYYGGWLDSALSRFTDVLLAFPGNLLAIAVIAVLGPSIMNIIFSVAVYSVPIFLRIVRGITMEIKNRTYVEAARSIGVRDSTIILKHIFPGTISVVMVYLTMRIGTAILIGASLSFLGLGGDITAPEWGAMLSAAKDNSSNVFHPTFFPGLAIVITVLSFNLLGDGLRDALDPKLKD